MKTISELQNELRGIKKDLSDIDARLNSVDSELSNYKDSSTQISNDNNIYKLAQTLPKIEHPISKENLTVKNNYFSILLMISTVDDSINDEQLLFLQRIALSDEQNSRLDSYISNLGNINFQNVLFQLDERVKDKYSKQLLLDMIILSNLSKSKEKKSYEVIASISAFLGIEKSTIREITQIAKTILLNDSKHLPDGRDVKDFDYYLCEVPGYLKVLHQHLVDTISFFHTDDYDSEQNDFFRT